MGRIRGVLAFLALTFSLTWGLWAVTLPGLDPSDPGDASVMAAVVAGSMFIPGLSSVVVRLALGEGFDDAGLALGRAGYYAMAYGLTVLMVALAYGLTLALGLGRWMPLTAVDLPLTPWGPSVPFPLLVVLALTAAPLINMVFAFGEELGWRGYLLPKLLDITGPWTAYAVTGVVWGLWHAPLIYLFGYNYGPPNRVLGIPAMVILCTALTAYIGLLRMRSGSTLVAALAHGTFNAQGFWKVLVWGYDPLLGGLTGLTGAASAALMALVVARVGRR